MKTIEVGKDFLDLICKEQKKLQLSMYHQGLNLNLLKKKVDDMEAKKQTPTEFNFNFYENRLR